MQLHSFYGSRWLYILKGNWIIHSFRWVICRLATFLNSPLERNSFAPILRQTHVILWWHHRARLQPMKNHACHETFNLKTLVTDTKHSLPQRPVIICWGMGLGILLQGFPCLISFDWIATGGCSWRSRCRTPGNLLGLLSTLSSLWLQGHFRLSTPLKSQWLWTFRLNK